jgi:hypothetical protein
LSDPQEGGNEMYQIATLVLSVVLPVANMIYQTWMIDRLLVVTDPIILLSTRIEALVSGFVTVICYGLSTGLAIRGLVKHEKPAYIFYIALIIIAGFAAMECFLRGFFVAMGEPSPKRVAQAMGDMLFVYLPPIAACLPLLAAFISYVRSEKPT